ncbi:hypothetical protein ACLEPN_17415 [Myxococcus sp. 1LA]
MRRLLTLAVPLALMMGTGCVAHVHGPAHHAPVQVVEYSYSSDHPIPDDFGGGWCPYSHMHVHDYEPTTTYYTYSDNAYYYSGPSVVWYWDDHPHAHGGLCSLRGRHSHDYYPSTGSIYRYERNRGYVWSRTHSASAGYGYVRPAQRPSRPVVPGNTYSGGRSPPSGTGWGTQPPRGNSSGGHSRPNRGQGNNSSGWGRGNPPPARPASGSSSNGSSGNGWSSPPSGRATNNAAPRPRNDDDRRDNDSGSSNSGSSNSGNSGNSGGGWNTRGGGSGGRSSSSGSATPPSGRSGSSSSGGSSNGRWR